MEISPNPKKELRSKLGAIATAVGFAIAIGSVSIAPARAAEHGGEHGGGGHGGGGHRAVSHGGGGYHGGGGHWGGGYYAPGPDYYVAPEPYVYVPAPAPCYPPGYEGPNYDPYYCTPPPPPGISLFFGL
jgi:hypothetical protein